MHSPNKSKCAAGRFPNYNAACCSDEYAPTMMINYTTTGCITEYDTRPVDGTPLRVLCLTLFP